MICTGRSACSKLPAQAHRIPLECKERSHGLSLSSHCYDPDDLERDPAAPGNADRRAGTGATSYRPQCWHLVCQRGACASARVSRGLGLLLYPDDPCPGHADDSTGLTLGKRASIVAALGCTAAPTADAQWRLHGDDVWYFRPLWPAGACISPGR